MDRIFADTLRDFQKRGHVWNSHVLKIHMSRMQIDASFVNSNVKTTVTISAHQCQKPQQCHWYHRHRTPVRRPSPPKAARDPLAPGPDSAAAPISLVKREAAAANGSGSGETRLPRPVSDRWPRWPREPLPARPREPLPARRPCGGVEALLYLRYRCPMLQFKCWRMIQHTFYK